MDKYIKKKLQSKLKILVLCLFVVLIGIILNPYF